MTLNENDEFLLNREKFAESIGCKDLFNYIDQFALYAGEHTIGNKLFTYELLKRTCNIPGHIAEFGCWKGSNLMFLAKLKRLMEPHSPKKIIGIDNFSGLPRPVDLDGSYAIEQTGHYRGDEEVVRSAIALFKYTDLVELVVGDAASTVPNYLRDNEDLVLSFAYLDFDLYEPSRHALKLIDQTISVGGIIVFDQACTAEWPGETVAMKEFLANSDKTFETINNNFSRQPTLALKRIQ